MPRANLFSILATEDSEDEIEVDEPDERSDVFIEIDTLPIFDYSIDESECVTVGRTKKSSRPIATTEVVNSGWATIDRNLLLHLAGIIVQESPKSRKPTGYFVLSLLCRHYNLILDSSDCWRQVFLIRKGSVPTLQEMSVRLPSTYANAPESAKLKRMFRIWMVEQEKADYVANKSDVDDTFMMVSEPKDKRRKQKYWRDSY